LLQPLPFACGSRLLDELGTFISGEAGGRGPVLRYFSGHDSTLIPLLSALGAWGGEWPPYAASVVFEVWGAPGARSPDATTVVVRYNGVELLAPRPAEGGNRSASRLDRPTRLDAAGFRRAVRGVAMTEREWLAACGVEGPGVPAAAATSSREGRTAAAAPRGAAVAAHEPRNSLLPA